jgi:hypothetical protein
MAGGDRGADAAVAFFGHTDGARVPFLAAATRLIASTMKMLAQSRLVVVSGVSMGAGSQVSRAGLARAVLQELESPRFAQQAVYIREH